MITILKLSNVTVCLSPLGSYEKRQLLGSEFAIARCLFVCREKLDMPTTSTKQTTYLDSQVELRVPAGFQTFANKTTRYSPEKTYGGHLIKLVGFSTRTRLTFQIMRLRKRSVTDFDAKCCNVFY